MISRRSDQARWRRSAVPSALFGNGERHAWGQRHAGAGSCRRRQDRRLVRHAAGCDGDSRCRSGSITISRDLYFDGAAETAAGRLHHKARGSGLQLGMSEATTGPLQGWVDGSNAFFAGQPWTIEITAPVQVASMTFLTTGYALEGATITLLPSPSASFPSPIDVESGSAAIDCQIVVTPCKRSGAGTLVLAGGNGSI